MFTLKDFNELPCIYNTKILTAKDMIKDKVIENIAVIELPVDDFIRNNELVLTTAIGCHNDSELFMNFVKNVYLSKAAGLVLSIKDKSYKIPKQILDYAESKKFPIIMIPWDCRFSEIVEAVLSEIRQSNTERNNFYSDIQKDLLSSYLNSMDLSVAAHIIAKHLKAAIVIVDSNYNVKGVSQNTSIDFMERASLLDYFDVLANIQVKDTLYGYLLVASKEPSLCFEASDIEYYLTMPLSLWFDKEVIIDSTKVKLISDFIWNLALDRFKSQESMYTKARLMGFDLNKPYTCILGKLSYVENMSAPDFDYKYLKGNEMNSVINQIALLSESFNRDIMITYNNNLILLYIENIEHKAAKDIHLFLDSVDNKLKTIDSLLQCSWGISEIKYVKTNFHKYYLNAKLALELSQKKNKRNIRSTYEDSNIFKILTVLSKDNEFKKIAYNLLEELINYDKSKGSSLLVTLKAFIQNNYNVSKTARELHLHRQSLLYRLDKIQELTSLDLNNHDNLFLLEICTRFHSD